MAREIGDIQQQARANDCLASICDATGDPCRARRHWHRALVLFAGLGVPDTERIRAKLGAQR